jgi:hypothetical protein
MLPGRREAEDRDDLRTQHGRKRQQPGGAAEEGGREREAENTDEIGQGHPQPLRVDQVRVDEKRHRVAGPVVDAASG